ncbi:MAG: DNA repair exonuclease [Candidatus Methanoperedens sp.]|nr:DNA repair exonuclease [Candidatus Methanoperedens sp.]MCZ7405891.1 DNA repair exonuclease [Candidatus Methanoperedens sp.]
MNSLRVLHVADVHLGAKFKGLPPNKARNRREDLKNTFGKIIALAKSSKSTAILIAGDLFDNPNPNSSLVSFVTNEMEKAEIPIFLTPGNHDSIIKGSVYSENNFPSNVVIFNPEFSCKTIGDLAVHGVAYDPNKPEKHILKDLTEPLPDKFNVALVHGSYNFMDFGDENYYPIAKEEIERSGMDYIALGHFHTFSNLKTSVPACYPGTPEGLGFKDIGDRDVLLIDFNQNGAKIEPININSKKYEMYELDCSDLINELEIKNKISECADPNKLLRVNMFGVPQALIELDTDALLEEIENSFFHLELIDNIHSPTEIQADNTIKGAFINKIQEKIGRTAEPEEKKLLERALKLGLLALEGEENR